jgi:DNA transformation protein
MGTTVAGRGGPYCGLLLASATVTPTRKLAKLASKPHPGDKTMARPRIKFRSLRVTPEFRDFVLDQLAGVAELRSRRMFGGVGLYSGERFFAILAADELFFKVDDGNRTAYETAGSEPFRPLADPQRPVSMSYWRVPLEVLEDSAELTLWARAAIRAANAQKRQRQPVQKRAPRDAK